MTGIINCLCIWFLLAYLTFVSSNSWRKRMLARMLNADESLFHSVKLPKSRHEGRNADFSSTNKMINDLQNSLGNIDVLKGVFGNYKSLYPEDKMKDYDDEKHILHFQANMMKILRHNQEAQMHDYEKALNQFSDIDSEEMIRRFTGFKQPLPDAKIYRGRPIEELTLMPPLKMGSKWGRKMSTIPKVKDWRKLGAVTPPKNQGSCGSCTLFAAAGALESSMFIWHKKALLNLSEQQLLDCMPPGDGHYGCDGNFMETTLTFMKTNGEGLDRLSPYKNKQGKCKKIPTVAKVKDFYRLPQDETKMKYYLSQYGPITATIHINEDLQQYSSGIFSGDCKGEINHSVLIVGYGSEKGKDYWIVKNSWSQNWGEKGYFRIRRNQNMCQIADYAFMITS